MKQNYSIRKVPLAHIELYMYTYTKSVTFQIVFTFYMFANKQMYTCCVVPPNHKKLNY